MLNEMSGLKIYYDEDHQLCCEVNGKSRPVDVHRLFPWTEAERFFSLRASDGEEVALVTDILELPVGSRAAMTMALKQSGFYFEITNINAVEEEYELRHWNVETRQGPRIFQTALDEFPRELPDGGLLIEDIQKDIYVIHSPSALSEPGRTILWAFVD